MRIKIIKLSLMVKCALFLLVLFYTTTSLAQEKKKIVKSYRELDYFTLKGHKQVKGLFKGNYRVKLTWLEGDTSKLPNLITVYFKRAFSGRITRQWYIYQDKNKEGIISIRPKGGALGYGSDYHDSTYHTPNKVICLKTYKEGGIIMEKMISIVEKIDDKSYKVIMGTFNTESYFVDINLNNVLQINSIYTNLIYLTKDGKNYISGTTLDSAFEKKKTSISLFWLLQLGKEFIANNW